MKRDFLSLLDFSREELVEILDFAAVMKREFKSGATKRRLSGRTLAMIFEKPSLRTRVTFEVGMTQLGGYAVYLTPNDIQLGERESVADIARNLDRWVDLIMARTYAHRTLIELARHAAVPVINGLSDLYHPCQVLSDCLTITEFRGRLQGQRVAFVGDGNNVANSWISAATRLGFEFILACPPGYEPDDEPLNEARRVGAAVVVTSDPEQAVRGADVVYTDVWTSMGQEDEAERRKVDFSGYQVNSALLDLARPDAIIMHCLPAHRGQEITAEVIDGKQSVVFSQAENRLHLQKAVLVWLVERCNIAKR